MIMLRICLWRARAGATVRIASSLLVLMLTALMTGCASYPMGMSREQWEALPAEQQAGLQAEQYRIDEARRRAAAEREMQRRLAAEEAARAERERVAALYRNAVYGDIVRVTIQGGALQIHQKRHPFQPVAFELARGESKPVTIAWSGSVQQAVTFQVRLSTDGQTLFFDDDQTALVNNGWERGEVVTLGVAGHGNWKLVNPTFRIQYRELPGAPNRLIIEQR
jgi:hypothetical protein